MKNICLVFVLCLGMMLGACRSQSVQRSGVTTGSLLIEMIDLAAQARFPNPAFRTIQYSSYDRRSRLPGGPDWFANSDGFGKEPIPNFERVLREPDNQGIGEYLIADVKGPGAIVRLWSAAISGEIRLYLDGNTTPVYSGSAIDFFHKTYDDYELPDGLDYEQMSKTIYQRDASYAPLPFAKRMRLVWEGNLDTIHFYQVQVRIYTSPTRVTTFSPEDLTRFLDTFNRVSLVLSDPDAHMIPTSSSSPIDFNLEIPSGKKSTAFSLDGPGALEYLKVKIEAGQRDLALRQTLMNINCDGYPWGHVQSPVGDFFGAAPGINPFRSLPFSVHPDGTMVCRFVMPYKTTISVSFENLGSQNIRIHGSALPNNTPWDDDRSMHFRARWRIDHDLIASNQAVQDLPFLLASGQGVYVGTTAFILNPNEVPTPYGNWWGEGDEKVFLDNDPMPAVFGTGSEDYFNYSWSSPEIFDFPYCGQPRNDGPGNRGFVTNFRWHILDRMPFQNGIRFFMELYSHERTPGLSYGRIAYHYARPGLTDDSQVVMPSDLRPPELPPKWSPAARMGARNSVIYQAEQILRGNPATRFKEGRLWADSRLMVWNPRSDGEQIQFDLPITEPGNKKIYITAALTPDSGRIELQLDGEPVTAVNQSNVIDLRRPFRTMLRSFSLPDKHFSQGTHRLKLIYKGTSESVEQPIVGVDFIWIQNRP